PDHHHPCGRAGAHRSHRYRPVLLAPGLAALPDPAFDVGGIPRGGTSPVARAAGLALCHVECVVPVRLLARTAWRADSPKLHMVAVGRGALLPDVASVAAAGAPHALAGAGLGDRVCRGDRLE